jgi:hypothetical protein
VKLHPETLFILFARVVLCLSVLAISTLAQMKTHCVELGGGSEMCQDADGEVDWLNCDVPSCSFIWEPASPRHLKVLDQAIAEEEEFIAVLDKDTTRAALAEKHKRALAELRFLRSKIRAAITPPR